MFSIEKKERVQQPTKKGKKVEIIEKYRDDHRQGSHALGRVIGHPREENEYFTTDKGKKKKDS